MTILESKIETKKAKEIFIRFIRQKFEKEKRRWFINKGRSSIQSQ